MKDYYFDKDVFVINNYLKRATFSDFLPGIAGKKGIPLWTFYVNRGQGISGFGLQDKNHPIMEFTPANKAYESVGQIGFRTFMKIDGKYYEPFVLQNEQPHLMRISRSDFSIIETNEALGVKIKITYFGLPNENIGGLVRQVEITNISAKPFNIELLDGIAEILPSGVKNQDFKAISNLLRSWMDVEELDKNIAFYNLRSSTGDEAEVKEIKSGNFLFGIINDKLIRPIVDQELIFGFDNLKKEAETFKSHKLSEIISQKQITVNKVPAGFIPFAGSLKPGEAIRLNIVSGFTYSREFLHDFISRAKSEAYINKKAEEAKAVIDDIVKDVKTKTASPVFDEYIKQSYLDNAIRGGYPYKIGNTIYHLYSRRHGDLERDYNFFSLAPEYYSQGNGNFRDVCQNRRMDSFIYRDVEDFNVKYFASLIQLDGYNPLGVNGMLFKINDEGLVRRLVGTHFDTEDKAIINMLKSGFTPGGLVNFIENNNIAVKTTEAEYLDAIINSSQPEIQADFGEGYWTDHFTYMIDLVESFEAIYPDRMQDLMHKHTDILTYDSPVTVLPKHDKTVITNNGEIRQFGSLLHMDEEKISRLGMNRYGSNWVKIGNDVFRTNLFNKLLILVLNKHAQLDHQGLGVEMEANKPGWNDAMNGLPGLFGSGIGETIETTRIIEFLLKYLPEAPIGLPKAIADLFNGLASLPHYGERIALREIYRSRVRFGLEPEYAGIDPQRISAYLNSLNSYLLEKLTQVFEAEDAIIPTYIVNNVTEYEALKNNGQPVIGNYGLPLAIAKNYQHRFLPKFLEAPARLLKIDFDKAALKKMYRNIKKSNIYDEKLKIYKTSEFLDEEGYEIGRVRAFTKGWLERESDFLHMSYKYLLGLLKAGLYREYYEEIKTNLVCFMDPDIYKRNPLENTSFIASSVNPDAKVHGQGFLPRLSGSTVEAIEMWAYMMTGGKPFVLIDGELAFKPEPKLPKAFFDGQKSVSFTFLKDVHVTYYNEDLIDTYESGTISRFELINDQEKKLVDNNFVNSGLAEKIRTGYYKEIRIYIKK